MELSNGKETNDAQIFDYLIFNLFFLTLRINVDVKEAEDWRRYRESWCVLFNFILFWSFFNPNPENPSFYEWYDD